MNRSLNLVLRLVTTLALLVVVAMVTVPKAPALSTAPAPTAAPSVLSDSPNFCPDTDASTTTTVEDPTAPSLLCGPPCCHTTPTGRCACIKDCTP